MSPTRHICNLRARAHTELLQNVANQTFLPLDGNPAHATIDGQKVPLPAYVPYIGLEYFQYRPRILCYAINQNLSKHAPWTDQWTERWASDFDLAIDRLNRAAEEGQPLPIKPYAEGFIPLAAALALSHAASSVAGTLPAEVDRVIAVTNFVKFSTSDDASSSSIPGSWWRQCADRYVRKEILTLKPDILLAFGKRTTKELERVLRTLSGHDKTPRIFSCRFPARIPSLRARPLRKNELREWEETILPLVPRIRKPPVGAWRKWRMLRFPGYFVDLAQRWNGNLTLSA